MLQLNLIEIVHTERILLKAAEKRCWDLLEFTALDVHNALEIFVHDHVDGLRANGHFGEDLSIVTGGHDREVLVEHVV